MKLLIIAALCFASCSADHSGAYSSPQYAKKMFPNFDPTGNGLLPKEKPPIPYKNTRNYYEGAPEVSAELVDGRNESGVGRSSFLSSASSFLSGRGGQVVSEMAKEFLSRSTGAGSSQVRFECLSQVLSLNLTNLVILVVLKALIMAAGFFGAGAWKGGHGYGRSLDDYKNAEYISEEEIQLYLGYLRAQQSGDYSCLQLASCRRPQEAALYSSGADLLLRAARLMPGDNIDVTKMKLIAEAAREAVVWGKQGNQCDERYQCSMLT